MTCHNCQTSCKRFGKHRNGLQRFRCTQCRKTYTEEHERPLDEMRLPLDRADIDASTLISLTFAYKHLWIKYQELRYMEKYPDSDPETVREAVFDEIDDLFRPVGDALSDGQPVRELLLALVNTVQRAKELPFEG